MKKLILAAVLGLGMLVFLGNGVGLAEDAPKKECPKTACFSKMDTDNNGEISEAEFLENCKTKFAAMDKDKNGSLNKDEFQPCCMKKMPEKKECPFMKQHMEK